MVKTDPSLLATVSFPSCSSCSPPMGIVYVLFRTDKVVLKVTEVVPLGNSAFLWTDIIKLMLIKASLMLYRLLLLLYFTLLL